MRDGWEWFAWHPELDEVNYEPVKEEDHDRRLAG
jgi:hypothetical protein